MRHSAWALVVVAVLALAPTQTQTGSESLRGAVLKRRWSEGFGVPGVHGGRILAWAVYDDGSGPSVYAGGYFRAAGDVVADGIARWDGERWHPVGEGVPLASNPGIRALAVFDDGSGPALYVGGEFDQIGGQPAEGFARWDGSSWTVLPGVTGFGIYDLEVGEDGEGPALFVGGAFTRAGTVSTANVGRWDGQWSAMPGLSFGQRVYALSFYEDDGGVTLYAGMDSAGFPSQPTVRKWFAGSWIAPAGAPTGPVYALEVFDDGSGEKLFAGGFFGGGVESWNGAVWSAPEPLPGAPIVRGLAVLPGPSPTGEVLVAAGSIASAGGLPVGNIAAWDGTSWLSLAGGVTPSGTIEEVAALDTGAGPELYVGGAFFQAGGELVQHAARWDGASWFRMGEGSGLDASVNAFAEFDDGAGPALHAGGYFGRSGGRPLGGLARWDGRWTDVGGGVSGWVNALTTFGDGASRTLAVAGGFSQVGGPGGLGAANIASWDGADWDTFGAGLDGEALALAVFDDGTGPSLYAGGKFTVAGETRAVAIARWDETGRFWLALPGELSDASGFPSVEAMVVHDDGRGPALFVGGRFDFAGSTLVDNIARWDGVRWEAAPEGGVTGVSNTGVRALLSVDLPGIGEPALVVGGIFDTAGSVPANGLALLRREGWSTLGTFPGGFVESLAVFDDGAGPRLYGGGRFPEALLRWTGASWRAVDGGLANAPGSIAYPFAFALHAFDDGRGPALFVGGRFEEAGPMFSLNAARWIGAPHRRSATLPSSR